MSTVAFTQEQYLETVQTIENGFLNHRPNPQVAHAIRIEANLGLRISDVLSLKLDDIVFDGGRYRLDVIEQKTQKVRTFTVPLEMVEYLRKYNKEHNISDNEYIFTIKTRMVQTLLKECADYLGYKNIGTHSARKFFATTIYNENEHDIALIQTLLQHSSASITQRYLSVSTQQVENALNKHICL